MESVPLILITIDQACHLKHVQEYVRGSSHDWTPNLINFKWVLQSGKHVNPGLNSLSHLKLTKLGVQSWLLPRTKLGGP